MANTPIILNPNVGYTVVAGTWVCNINDGFWNNYCIENGTSHNDGDSVSYEVSIPADGNYSLVCAFYTASTCGLLDIYADATKIVDQWDLYSAGATFNVKKTQTAITLAKKIITLKFIINGKNGASSNHNMYLQRAELIRES